MTDESIPTIARGLVEADFITLTEAQIRVMSAMDSFYGHSIRVVSADTLTPEKEVRAIMRRFHTVGIAEFGTLYDEDSTQVMGRGYWLSRLGSDTQQQARRYWIRPPIAHLQQVPA